MAGMIQQAAPQGAKPAAAQPQNAPETDENNPVYKQAVAFAFDVLYKSKAANDVSSQLQAASSLPEGMADIAYNITSIVDEKTNGAVPDELLIPLAMRVLEEVASIAEASGLEPTPQDVAGAFKTMILRYLGEQGVNTTQLEQAMSQVDPSVFQGEANQNA